MTRPFTAPLRIYIARHLAQMSPRRRIAGIGVAMLWGLAVGIAVGADLFPGPCG